MLSSAGIIPPTLEEFIKSQTKQSQKETNCQKTTKQQKPQTKQSQNNNNDNNKKAKKPQPKQSKKQNQTQTQTPNQIYFCPLTNIQVVKKVHS